MASKNFGLISDSFFTYFARAPSAAICVCIVFAAEKGGKSGLGSGV
jgi:hypothetical protein